MCVCVWLRLIHKLKSHNAHKHTVQSESLCHVFISSGLTQIQSSPVCTACVRIHIRVCVVYLCMCVRYQDQTRRSWIEIGFPRWLGTVSVDVSVCVSISILSNGETRAVAAPDGQRIFYPEILEHCISNLYTIQITVFNFTSKPSINSKQLLGTLHFGDLKWQQKVTALIF